MILSNLSLRKKFLFLSAFLMLVVAFESATIFIGSTAIKDQTVHIEDKTISILNKAYQMKLSVVQVQQWLTDISATRGLDGLNDGFDEAAANADQFRTLISDLKEIDSENKASYNSMLQAFEAYYKVGQQMAQAYIDSGPAGGNRMMGNFDEVAEKISSDVDIFLAQAQQTTQTSLASQVEYANTSGIFIIIGSLVILIVISVYFLLNKNTIDSLHNFVDIFRILSEGDLTLKTDTKRNDELGELSNMFNTASSDIGYTISSINYPSQELTSIATELLTASKEMENKVKHQAREIDQVAAAVSEMSATVQEMASNTTQAKEAADNAESAANNGKKAVASSIETANSVAQEVNTTSETIRRLESDSASVSVIVDTIRDIAEQTNLLALNAAIEAARAGENGRGFAVVADEVRSLASRTQEATGEIQQMIEKFQKDTNQAANTMQAVKDAADSNVKQSASTNDALQEIVDSVAVITNMNQQIASAAEELDRVMVGVDQNIATVNEAAQHSTQVATQTYESGTRVTVLSGEIRSLLKRFHVSADAVNYHNEHRKSLFVWSDVFDVGINEINRQHKVLINIVNEIYNLECNNRSPQMLRRTLEGLIDYTETHFTYEEYLLESNGYPEFAPHKAKHVKLLSQVGDFVQRIDRGEDIAAELLEFLTDWLSKHIQGTDKKYGPFLNQNGIS